MGSNFSRPRPRLIVSLLPAAHFHVPTEQAKMDMDVDMDVSYSVSVFIISRVSPPPDFGTGKSQLTHRPFPSLSQTPTITYSWTCEQRHGVSGNGGYDVNNHNYGLSQSYYNHDSQSQQSQLQRQRHFYQGSYGRHNDAIQIGHPSPTLPAQPQAITEVTVVVDTNVLLDYLMVIQKFVADIERTKWPSVVVIPSVVISELDWCVGV